MTNFWTGLVILSPRRGSEESVFLHRPRIGSVGSNRTAMAPLDVGRCGKNAEGDTVDGAGTSWETVV